MEAKTIVESATPKKKKAKGMTLHKTISVGEAEHSIIRLGSYAGNVVAILYIVVSLLIAVDPVGMYIDSSENLGSLMLAPYINIIWRILFALLSFISIMLINAMATFGRCGSGKGAGIVEFARYIMIASLVIATLNWIHFVHVTSVLLDLNAQGISSEGTYYFPIDSYFVWSWGVYGLGLVLLCCVFMRNGIFTKRMGIAGLFCGVESMSTVVLYVMGVEVNIAGIPFNGMILMAGILGFFTAPIFISMLAKYMRSNIVKASE